MTAKMMPAGTTDGTLQRLEAKIKRLETALDRANLLTARMEREAQLAFSAGKMEGTRLGLRR